MTIATAHPGMSTNSRNSVIAVTAIRFGAGSKSSNGIVAFSTITFCINAKCIQCVIAIVTLKVSISSPCGECVVAIAAIDFCTTGNGGQNIVPPPAPHLGIGMGQGFAVIAVSAVPLSGKKSFNRVKPAH